MLKGQLYLVKYRMQTLIKFMGTCIIVDQFLTNIGGLNLMNFRAEENLTQADIPFGSYDDIWGIPLISRILSHCFI